MELPIGIRILAISAGVVGSLAALAALLFALMGAGILFQSKETLAPWVGTTFLIAGSFALLLMLPLVVFAIGAWQGRGWAWWLGIVWFGLAAASAVLNTLTQFVSRGWLQSITWGGVALLLSGIVWYLLTPTVRHVFLSAS